MSALPQSRTAPRAASTSGRPHLRLVGAPRHTRLFTVCIAIVLAVGVFGIVSLNALAAEQAFEARTLETRVAQLSTRYDELTARVAHLESPARLRRVAMVELGMVAAEEQSYLTLRRPDGSIATRPVADPVKQAFSLRR
ncbi:MAG: hypothetical protein ACR2MA_00420 [Egibacteraceae bacterium]